MDRLQKRALVYLASIILAVVGFTLAYQHGMQVFEGEERSLAESLMVVVQTYTTVGYGQDASFWSTPQMNLIMTGMQITGVFHLFIALPLFVIPWIQQALERSPPEALPDLTDHVVIVETLSLGDTLVEELVSRETSYVVVEPDGDRAREMHDHGQVVVHGDPEDPETLEGINLAAASQVVVDSTDDRSPSIVLAVREVRPEIPISCIVRDPDLAPYMRYAGADTVLSPRQLLGRSMADKASSAVTDAIGEAVDLGRDLHIVELPVMPESALCDQRLDESRIRERTGASVLGVWLEGDFLASPPSGTVLDERSVLLVAGQEDQLEALTQLARSEARRRRPGPVVVLGLGEVGATVDEMLSGHGVSTTIVDDVEGQGADVVGDATHEEVQRDAGVGDAGAVVVALPDDTRAIFAILVAREINPNVEIVARANDSENVPKMYRAGADYVLSLASVSGRMVARSLFGEDVMTPASQIKMIRTGGEGLAGQSLSEADVGNRTGCTVVAVERNGDVLTDLGPDFVVLWDDNVIVAGTDEDVQRFNAEFGG